LVEQGCRLFYSEVFGCKAYAHISRDEWKNLKPMSLEFIFLGFEKGVKGYRLWDLKNKKKVLSRDVVFDELTTSRTEANYLKKKNVNTA